MLSGFEELSPESVSIDTIKMPLYDHRDIEVSVLRLDRIHPVISGNKWFKLQFYLRDAIDDNKNRIATFGGAWSNHIVATAAACHLHQLKSIGIIRGEQPATLSPTLKQAQEYGMKLFFISREAYKRKEIPEEINCDVTYFINEGGYGPEGVAGAATIAAYYQQQSFTHICCAAGTGTMIAGLIATAASSQQIIGISALKNNKSLEPAISDLLPPGNNNFQIFHDYHFGGYAKYKPSLIQFMNAFYEQTSIPLDFVYTAKLFFGVHNLISQYYFPPGSKLLLIHSGGLQGNISLGKGTLIF